MADWGQLAQHTEPIPPVTERAREIARAWVRQIADRYFGDCVRAVRRHDPNHLVLGSRFAGAAPDIWDIAGRHCEVVSFNMYPRIDVERGVPQAVAERIAGWAQAAARPLMITEWSFPALDAGLPCRHGAGMRVDTQSQRAQCFTHFQSLMFSLPFMVGSNFFMFVDEPAQGISETFPEDSNYGLVNEQDEPYQELTAAAATLNPKVCKLHRAGKIRTIPPVQLLPWLSEPPERLDPPHSEILTLKVGDLALQGPSQGRWQVRLAQVLLGEWFPLIHQQVGRQDLWVGADRGRLTGIHETKHAVILEMEMLRGEQKQGIARADTQTGQNEVQIEAPRRFRSGWRLWVPKQRHGVWFAIQWLWVHNTDEKPWQLAAIYPFLTPTLGGESAGDEPLSVDVPNYYRRGAAWVDEGAKLGIGCWYANDHEFQCRYWKDPDGGFHADLRRVIEVVLEPNQRYDQPGPVAFFFPFRDMTRAGFARAVAQLEQTVTRRP